MSTSQDSQQDPDVEGVADANTQFSIQRIYVKDVSFEAPNSPDVFRAEWKPEVQLHVNSSAPALGENVYDVTLTVTVTATLGERTAFLAEVQQAGIFNVAGLNDADLGMMLGAFCPNILFPYAREAVTSLVARGGFPQLVLAPVNFDALYLQQLEQKQAAARGEAEAES